MNAGWVCMALQGDMDRIDDLFRVNALHMWKRPLISFSGPVTKVVSGSGPVAKVVSGSGPPVGTRA